MADRGFIPGFIGMGIDITIHYILDQINVALRCKKEMNSLRRLVQRIEPIIRQIQQYRLALNWKKGIRNEAPAVKEWLKKLDGLLRQASTMAHECTIPSWDVISRYKTSKRVTALVSEINEHLDTATLMAWSSVLEGFGQMKEIILSSDSSSATTSATGLLPLIASTGFFIKEPLILGQEIVLSTLEKLMIDEAVNSPLSLIGVVGKGGSGKTLLLKTLFTGKVVRYLFCNGLFLWLTVSQTPSFTSLLNELYAQIAMQTREVPDKNMNRETLQIWLNDIMQGKRFVLILDDVWENGAELLEELGLAQLTEPSSCTVIVSSRNRRALLEMGVAEKAIIRMGDLMDADSWRLFSYHAFRSNNGYAPANIPEGTAKLVCAKCGGLPLAIKAVGRAMAGITDAYEWQLAVQRLPTANNGKTEAVYNRLRLSYDALGGYGANLQMCFLYSAVFMEDKIIQAQHEAIPFWIAEGLLSRKKLQDQCGQDPFEMGRIYVEFLADRCLIEPLNRGGDGNVLRFRMHDVVRDLAIQIAEREENFYFGTSKGLATLNGSGCTRISLSNSNLTSLPNSLSSSEICSLMVGKNNITELPRKLMGGMISLKILDLSFTSLASLPDRIGCLKQLVFLNLSRAPITILPASLTNLVNLKILDLTGTRITELPSGIHKLKSLKYLSLDDCRDLQWLPYSISGLTSLQYFIMGNCQSMWTKHPGKYSRQRAASVNDLSKLTQLRGLYLCNNGQAISDGAFGNLAEIEVLELNLGEMVCLPRDITNMAKLRRFELWCPGVVEMEVNFCRFQYLSHLRLWGCSTLEELPQLHALKNLRQLEILACIKMKKFPEDFSRAGAFPVLEILSLYLLEKLEELPIIEESAMLSLKEFTVVDCEALEMLPQRLFYLKTLEKIRVYGCEMVLKNLEKMKRGNTMVEVVKSSTEDTRAAIAQCNRVRNAFSYFVMNLPGASSKCLVGYKVQRRRCIYDDIFK